MPKLDPSKAEVKTGSVYPEPYNSQMDGRSSLRLGDLGGLTQFGANLVVLAPGAKSSLRHWHENEDEFVMMTQGSCTLIDDAGRREMKAGDFAAFPASDGNGHHFINETDAEARFLVVGSRMETECAHYPDDDMKVDVTKDGFTFTRTDGSPV